MPETRTMADVVKTQQIREKRIAEARQKYIEDDWTDEEIAQILGKKRSTIQKYIRDGDLIAYQIGKEYRVPDIELQRFRERMISENQEKARCLKIEAAEIRRFEFEKGQTEATGLFCLNRITRCARCGYRAIIARPVLRESFFWGYLEHQRNRWYGALTGNCAVCSYWYHGYEGEWLLKDSEDQGNDERLNVAIGILNNALSTVNEAERLRLLRAQLGEYYSPEEVTERLKLVRQRLSEADAKDPEIEEELNTLEAELAKNALASGVPRSGIDETERGGLIEFDSP